MEKPEEHRNKWALGLAITCSIFILFGYVLFEGYLSFNFGGNPLVAEEGSNKQVAAVVVAKEETPSPFQNTKKTFNAAFEEISKQYKEFTDSVSSVLVPFITGIEVYQKQ